MLKDITIGRYIYANSPLHRMDAGVKLVLTLVFAAVVFMIDTPSGYAIYTLFTALLIRMGAIPFKTVFRGFKPLVWIIIFTAFFNVFFVDGRELFEIAIFSVTYEGVVQAIELALRIMLLVAGTSVLTLTTPPLGLTDGLEKVMKPLGYLHIPVHELAMMMSIAIRFIPIIGDEAQRIMQAQTARGADMQSGGIVKRARAMIPVIIPLLVSSLKRSEELATAMDARCYNGAKRTRMNERHPGKNDAYAAVIMLAISAAALIF